jgi:hypothetical protein
MVVTGRRLRLVVPIALGALDLSHPAWRDSDVSQAVAAADGWWVPLHLLLILGYAALVRILWVPGVFVCALLVAFLVCNTAFLALDGIAVGLLATSDPAAADRLWNSALVTVLANLTGATWAASLLAIAAKQVRGTRPTPVLIGLGLTWLSFVASAPPLAAPALVSRVAAVATGGWVVYETGTPGLRFALLVFAAVLQQHVGAEGALGMLLVGAALLRLPEPD